MKVSMGTKAKLNVINAIYGAFPKVMKSKDSDYYYIPESEMIRIVIELGICDESMFKDDEKMIIK